MTSQGDGMLRNDLIHRGKTCYIVMVRWGRGVGKGSVRGSGDVVSGWVLGCGEGGGGDWKGVG